ncbi:MAG: gamma-glutamyltransferase family protein [Puniceicoccaceae bacterium]|nr:MAG: gamma-glutamyltransferase family protein [Puniceicoccaceae bacterium]
MNPDAPLDWRQPYPSRRQPVFARNLVATSQPLATEAGVSALRAGGNAVDAALAAAITLTVVEPTGNGLGSDAFALIWRGGRLHGFNGSGRSPRSLDPERLRGRASMPELGWETVTTPGAVDTWVQLSRKFGKLPFARLFEDAVRHAAEGFPLSPKIADAWRHSRQRFREFADFQDHFWPAGFEARPGEVFRSSALAATLGEIASTKGESFYRGRLARAMASRSHTQGGSLAEIDLAEHQGEWVEPLAVDYAGCRVHELPPNGQGLAALIALGILERLPVRGLAADSPDLLHFQIEAMRIAFTEAFAHFADPRAMVFDPGRLLDPGLLDRRAAEVDARRAGRPEPTPAKGFGTVCLAAADEEGTMVSFIQSNFHGFGSGIVIPNTGISLQNRGLGFVLTEGHPNRVGPGKRPFHTIIPAMVSRAGEPLLAFGLMGGHMQPQGHLQAVHRICVLGQNPQAAADAPRWYLQPDGSLALEPHFPEETGPALAERGHRLAGPLPEPFFGGMQAIARLPGGVYCGATEPRKDGCAAGF